MAELQDTKEVTEMFDVASPFYGLSELALSFTAVTFGHLGKKR